MAGKKGSSTFLKFFKDSIYLNFKNEVKEAFFANISNLNIKLASLWHS